MAIMSANMLPREATSRVPLRSVSFASQSALSWLANRKMKCRKRPAANPNPITIVFSSPRGSRTRLRASHCAARVVTQIPR